MLRNIILVMIGESHHPEIVIHQFLSIIASISMSSERPLREAFQMSKNILGCFFATPPTIFEVHQMPPKDMKMIVLGCMQCMYAASDLAGTMKLQYDISARIIRMPCTARLDLNFILKALQEGADGVLVVGCHPGDCAYKTGNLGAERRVRFARKLIGQLGLNENRVKMVFVSAAEGDKFAAEINQFAEEIRKIGPNPIRL